jgi:5-methylcytosine-specific restriction endonuclease McrA
MSEAWSSGSDRRWRTFRATILERDQGLCTLRLDKCTNDATEVHHIVPLSKGGQKYDPENCASSCKTCNLQVGNRNPVPQPQPQPRSTW